MGDVVPTSDHAAYDECCRTSYRFEAQGEVAESFFAVRSSLPCGESSSREGNSRALADAAAQVGDRDSTDGTGTVWASLGNRVAVDTRQTGGGAGDARD